MALQSVVLDPSEVAIAGRREINLDESEGVTVYYEGADWGSQEVKAFLAEALYGSMPIDHEWPLRAIKLPLVIRSTPTTTFDDVRVMLQQWVAAVNQEGGGWLKRVLPSGREIFADVVEAKLHLSASWLVENRDIDREATLELQALPDLYGPEATGGVHEFTGDGAFTEEVGGDIPARVTEMKVEDLSGNAQLGLMWHFRRRHYSSATTAQWAYNAESLNPLDTAEKVTLAGSYGTDVVKHPKLSTGWTPVLSTGFLTHVGLYDVWVRVWATSEKLPWLRLVYGVGDIVAPSENTQVQIPQKEGWYLLNLGQINVRKMVSFGSQRWEGVIQARTEGSGTAEAIWIDRLWFLCADECSGVLGALRSTTALTTTAGSDPLSMRGAKAEALNGTEGNRGGKWEDAASGTGFEREAEGCTRKTTGDAEARTALLASSTIGPVVVRCEIARTAFLEGLKQGVYLRYSASNYWVRVVVWSQEIAGRQRVPTLYVEYWNGGSLPEQIGLAELGSVPSSIEAEINSAAEVTVRVNGQTFRTTVPATFRSGEAHATGKVGIIDFYPWTGTTDRTYKNFLATAVPPADAVMYADNVAVLTTVGMFRASEDRLGLGSIGHPGTDLPRLPVSGSEEAPVEVAVKPSRGQFGELADSGKDKFKVYMSYRECFAEIPSS
jgi:hypothetical protein